MIIYQQVSVALSPFGGVLLSRLEGIRAGQAFQCGNLFRHCRFESIHAQLLDEPQQARLLSVSTISIIAIEAEDRPARVE